MPKGYWIAHVDVQNPDAYKNYVSANGVAFAKFGGRFLVRGGKTHTMEGDWSPRRLVVVEFPSVEQATAWWSSAEYAEAKALRQATSASQLIIAEGI
jgi:uncharacterized protein (DUF1330 family)